MRRAGVAQTLSDLIAFARIAAARLGSSKSAEVQLAAHEDDADGKHAELWGHAPLLYRPVPGAEALSIELGDERVVIATKDRRYQIEAGEGEVIVRALGAASPAYVHLQPNGTAIIHASSIDLGGGATQFVALAQLVESAIAAAIAGHTHTGVTTGLGTSGNGVLAAAVSSTAASKTKAE